MAVANDDRLRRLIERIERLEEEKKDIGGDIKDVYLEGKAVGYDAKIMRQIVRLRKMPPADRREMESILDLYKAALGMDHGPLFAGAAVLPLCEPRDGEDVDNDQDVIEFPAREFREVANG